MLSRFGSVAIVEIGARQTQFRHCQVRVKPQRLVERTNRFDVPVTVKPRHPLIGERPRVRVFGGHRLIDRSGSVRHPRGHRAHVKVPRHLFGVSTMQRMSENGRPRKNADTEKND